MNPEFIKRCIDELRENEGKGSWEDWSPNPKESIIELQWHVAKLCNSILSESHNDSMEYAADIANICEKIYDMEKNKKEREYSGAFPY